MLYEYAATCHPLVQRPCGSTEMQNAPPAGSRSLAHTNTLWLFGSGYGKKKKGSKGVLMGGGRLTAVGVAAVVQGTLDAILITMKQRG